MEFITVGREEGDGLIYMGLITVGGREGGL